MREAPSLVLAGAAALRGRRGGRVGPGRGRRRASPGVEIARTALEARVDGADAAVIVTEWPELREHRLGPGRRMRRRVLGRPEPPRSRELRDAGFVYEGIGRPARATFRR